MRLGLLIMTLFSALGLAVMGAQAAPWTSASGLAGTSENLLTQIATEICKPLDDANTVSVCRPLDDDDDVDEDDDDDDDDDE